MTQIIERPTLNGDDASEPVGTPLATVPGQPAAPDGAVRRPGAIGTPTMVQAINRALHDAMAADDRVHVFGEDVGTLGGVFRVTEGLAEKFGRTRCFDTPLAESAIIGVAVGMALRGLVPVPEIQFDGFAAPAFDQIVSHLAKYRMRTRGDVDMPVTVRIPSFGGIGAVEHHSESTETYWLHTAGLKVVTPATPSDAYWLLRQAITSLDPVIYLEPKRRYWTRGPVDTSRPELPMGRAAIRRPGEDVTVLTYGPLVATALNAADLAAERHGWRLEVVDLRSLNPLDFDTIAASVRRTGRAVVMHEGPRTLGFGAELAARLQEELFYDLEAPVLRATGFDTPYPPARLERLWLPGVDRLLDCVERAMEQP
ncbi:transketolase, pyrimidine binding domain protein [Mycolicibacterium hassiacum DSM 44199]|jgi:pyruvate dehydrogenase E1 component beta subunit|uniref:3-methyl-2-oxobutanoate dehydrogenase subunit beta n=1 Tax=Mycolicibacterium hassiacum (strain DSM 44199 / CIP 105218 / JCM 12690 / 3849) TaxID=1122247 RepID=K5B824_MYCHD|nr:alpha-ketoacid dehydrogenase subunit beta [Mycolicibacterium hassiacum]EKF22953.1 transketolase, pyrimidine binding domain protein [Mycolicibacterium hassiacum DSM 44199]MBX5487416.1 alpha-ketoacid dehydrogenase subunit beta [Mycolicibacterium hassiacum]MDA4087264.1 2-oxoisovalerate dehydrogenase subunit beta [Mycolicibacterium hassiacum DSM 44199]PZN16512.1 MAG: alpha-ketoacid dehydrogenase subunit beta [Mycolicibacterium hassiacum]VCT89423.1 3-methyl-2-oxobutanoate dehydrogenase subunit b